MEFRKELETLINAYSMENGSDTPDFILADYLIDCLKAFDEATRRRTMWYAPKDAKESKEITNAAGESERQIEKLKAENERLKGWLEDERRFKNEYQRQLYELLPKTSGVAMEPGRILAL